MARRDLWPRVEPLLSRVERPARYLNHEWGCATPVAEGDFAFCMIYPDTYELGQANQAVRILVNAVNAMGGMGAERAFLPAVDMADLMREEGVPLFSLESCRPVADFDVVGITLPHELAATNVLETLDLAGIPLRTADRAEGDPIVLAGGPCAYNPEPYAPFFDVILVGEGEEQLPETLALIRELRASGAPRAEILREVVRRVGGAYVPSLYRWRSDEEAQAAGSWADPLFDDVPCVVHKRVFEGFADSPALEPMIVPYTEVVHDRLNVEILRGCARGCRFCQAGMIYRPVRERSVEHLLELAQKLVDSTGYEEITLSSLSTGDYTCLPELAHKLMDKFQEERIALSLPSLRLDSKLKETLEETQKVRKTSLTYAMEAGTQRLRDVINKGITEENLMSSVSDAFAGGWSSVKLYFMFGLPTETTEDLNGIADLASKVVRKYFETPKNVRARGLRVNCSASCFVPKPFTPFQWEPQDTIEQFEEKQKHLCQIMHIKGVEFNWHTPQVSFLEACFARGDRKMADVLEAAWRLGCRFDGWTDQFSFENWMKAFEQCGVDPAFYANRRREKGELLPWAFIDAGVTEAYLWREHERAMRAEVTPDCRQGCQGCGLKRFEGACEGR